MGEAALTGGGSLTTPSIIWQPQPGPQTALLQCPVFEVLYGGARGGGKTDGMLGEWAQHAQLYGKDAVGRFFRRERTQLMETIARAQQLYIPIGAKWRESEKEFVFPNGARLVFSYLERDADAEAYQGMSFTRVYIEEQGNFPDPAPLMKLRATLRSAAGVPCCYRATANPGGPGHSWNKARYIDPAPRGWRIVTEDNLSRVYIPARIADNPKLLAADPGYVDRLKTSGSSELVRAWLDGDWDVVEGAFFDCWSSAEHVVRPVELPKWWTRFTGFDWGSARPFSVGWYAVSDGELPEFPAGALVRYREWYGCSTPNVGIKLPSEAIAAGIREREGDEKIAYRVADPAIFKVEDGPSIAEKMARGGVHQNPADNTRLAGWEQIRARLIGEDDRPMFYVFSTCPHLIRTLPALQHDEHKPEDVDTDGEDHCFVADTLVRTDKGLYSLQQLVETIGRVRSWDGQWHAYRSARLVRKDAAIVAVELHTGEIVRCTPDHQFLTTAGWVRADTLAGQTILSLSQRQSRSFWASAITDAVNTFSAKVAGCISRCGNIIAALYQGAVTFTMLPVTEATTVLPASNALKHTNTSAADTVKSRGCAGAYRSFMRRGRLGLGTARKLGLSGIERTMRKMLTRSKQSAKSSAVIAEQSSCRAATFAQTPANQHGDATRDWTMSSDLVESVSRRLSSIATVNIRPVPELVALLPALAPGAVCLSVSAAGRADVYCLTVPSTGCFALGNGLIVSNCADECRYALMSRPYTRLKPPEEKPVDRYRRKARQVRRSTGWAA